MEGESERGRKGGRKGGGGTEGEKTGGMESEGWREGGRDRRMVVGGEGMEIEGR